MRARFALLALLACSLIPTKVSGQSLPSGWSQRDVGAVGVAGSASQSNGVFTVSGAGYTIWGAADGFHYVYQPMAGDGSIVARVLSVTGIRSGSGTNPAVGVMIRESLNANSTHASSVYRINPMVEQLWRNGTGNPTQYVNSGSTPLPYWVKVVRSGSSFTSFISPDGATWTQVGSAVTISMATNVYIGLAVSTEDSCNCSLVTATFDNVSVNATPWIAPPSPWLDQDVGATGVPGNVGYSNGVFTVSGAGPTIWGTADGFHFVYQPISGDGTIVARVLSVTGIRSGSNSNPAVGVMIRETLTAGSTHASSVYRLGPMVEQLWRTSTGGTTQFVNSGVTPLPYWVKTVRSSNSFSSYISPDGVTWTQVGSTQTISMATSAYVGLAVSTEDSCNCSMVTATFDNLSVSSTASPAPSITSIWPTRGIPGYDVSISGSGFGNAQGNSTVLLNGTPLTINSWSATLIIVTIPSGATSGPLVVFLAPSMNASNPATFKVLPAAWLDQDVGAVGVQGNASFGNGVFTISAAGPVIYGTADGFHFVYQPLSGDGTIVARVLGVTGTRNGTNPIVGVMIRESLNANSTELNSTYRTNPLINLMWRATTAGSTSYTNSATITTPYWVKVTRSGSTFSAYMSANGSTWTQVGASQTITMATNAYVGLAVSSNDANNNSLVTATLDNVSITATSAQPPVITDINPLSGIVGSSVTIFGANFGPQGASTVTFNGVAAGPGIWTPNAISVPVPYAAATGNIVVKANGLNSNGVPFTVIPAPTIASLSPASGPVGTPVTITGANFGSTQGSSTVQFTGITAPTVTSWSPTSIVANVPNGAMTGGVVVTVSGVPSNIVSFTVTSTTPTITNLSPASGPVGTSVTIAGANFGSTPGTVTFNGISAAIGAWTSTSIVATVPNGATTGPVLVTANGATSNPANFTIYTVQPGSPSLFVHPNKMNMVVGQTQAIQLLDQNGVPFSSPSWSIANPSIAAIVPPVNQGDPTLLQANAVGNTTLTGTSPDGRTGSAQVSILAGTSLPIGTVQWEIPSLGSGTGITSIVQSVRIDDTTPDFYVFDQGANNGSGAFRAFTAGGQQKWMFTPNGVAPFLLAADDQGGSIYEVEVENGSPEEITLGRVDENGNLTWSQPHRLSSNAAIHPDGTIYFVQQDYLNTGNSATAVVALDGGTGQMKFAVPIPTGSYTQTDYTILNDPNGGVGDPYPLNGKYCTPGTSYSGATGIYFGNLTISSDGTIYLPIGTGNSSYDAMPCDSSPDPNHPGYPHLVKSTDGASSTTNYLQIMVIHSDGTYSVRQQDSGSSSCSGNSCSANPLNNNPSGTGATPDGNGGTLLAINSSGTSLPSAFYHDTGTAVTKLNLSFNPSGEILTGEDGTAYLAGANPSPSTAGAVAAINTTSNTINWTDSVPSTGSLQQLLAVPAAGGVVFEDGSGHLNTTDPNGIITPLFPGSNGTDAGPVNTTNANYWSLQAWLASLNGSFAKIIGTITEISASQRPVQQGSPQKQSAPEITNILTVVPWYYATQSNGNPVPLTGPNGYGALIASTIQPNAVPFFRFLGQAIYQQFKTDIESTDHRLGALGYIGHSFLLGTPATSVGLCFQVDPKTENTNVYTKDCIVQQDYSSLFNPNANVTIIPEYVAQFASTTKVIFVASCDISDPFVKLWNVNQDPATIATRALIIPNTAEVQDVNLLDAAGAWQVVAQYLSEGHTVNEATNAANAYAQSINSVSRWKVVGNGNLRIRTKTY